MTFQINPNVSFDEIELLALTSWSAYEVGPRPPGWTVIAPPPGQADGDFFKGDGSARALVLEKNNQVIISFRGTDGLADVGSYPFLLSGNGYIHNFDDLLEYLVSARPNAEFLITGHSLGGAAVNQLANIADTAFSGHYANAKYVAFASPKIFDKKGILNFGFENDPVFKLVNGVFSFPSTADNLVFANDDYLSLLSTTFSAHDIFNYDQVVGRLADSEFLSAMTWDDIIVFDASDGIVKYRGTSPAKQKAYFIGQKNNDDHIVGRDGAGIDYIEGFGGNDTLKGGRGNDVIRGGAGNDTIDGGIGNDTMHGGADNDVYIVDAPGDSVVEELNAGIDRVESSISFVLGSNLENLKLIGAAAINGTGNAEANEIVGNTKNNKLDGRAEDDTLTGGLGNDTFVYRLGDGSDTVTDFSAGAAVGDKLDFTAINRVRSLADVLAISSQSGTDTVIDFGNGSKITLAGVSMSSLHANDFSFMSLAVGKTAGSVNSGTRVGTANRDTMVLGAGNDFVTGAGNDDYINGGAGTDTVNYAVDGGLLPVYVNLSTSFWEPTPGVFVGPQSAIDTHGARDTLVSIENVRGTSGEDFIRGNELSNRLLGLHGDDVLIGGGHSDTFIGCEGDDIFDGTSSGAGDPDDTDVALYVGDGASAGIIANLSNVSIVVSGETVAAGTIRDGFGDTDTLIDIEGVTGSEFDDHIVGGDPDNDNFELFVGQAGNDFIDGGSGFDELRYTFDREAGGMLGIIANLSAAAVNLGGVFLDAGEVRDGHGDVDTVTNIEAIMGTAFSDAMLGSAGSNRFRGLGGADLLFGGDGEDTADYRRDADFGGKSGIVVNLYEGPVSITWGKIKVTLQANQVRDGFGAVDTLNSIENIIGTNFADFLRAGNFGHELYGLGGDDMLLAHLGSDWLDGGSGIDTVSYAGYGIGVTANLASGTGQGGPAQNDTYISIENLIGTNANDRLTGSSGANRIDGGAGDDLIDGGLGDDVLIGGTNGAAGDMLVYFTATTGLTVNLGTTAKQNTVGAGFDTISGFENLQGSSFGDKLTGSAGANLIFGSGGNDFINGGAGNDTLGGDAGNDQLTGGAGNDTFSFDVSHGDPFGNDTITDFAAGAALTDKIHFWNGIFTSYAEVIAATTDVGNDLLITSAWGTVLLKNVKSISMLHENDFAFS